MGTSSGTLQGIESLDATLSEIERKLNIIENAHVKIGSDQNDDVSKYMYSRTNINFELLLLIAFESFHK
jgi:hypothetical protein